jgi:hypothetical protein
LGSRRRGEEMMAAFFFLQAQPKLPSSQEKSKISNQKKRGEKERREKEKRREGEGALIAKP